MDICLPISLEQKRPLEPPESPYNQCGCCEYVGRDVKLGRECPACSTHLDGCLGWPHDELMELWHEEVLCWNHKKAELATVVAAFYFEASVFNMLYWATSWLDPCLKKLGALPGDVRDREEKIWQYLASLDNIKKTNAALQKVFGDDGEIMLATVLGKKDAASFWRNYMNGREWRNQIAHRGRRIYFERVPAEQQRQAAAERDEMLWASLNFIPQCWVVFSRLWNEYIHKPMLTCRKKGDTGCD